MLCVCMYGGLGWYPGKFEYVCGSECKVEIVPLTAQGGCLFALVTASPNDVIAFGIRLGSISSTYKCSSLPSIVFQYFPLILK